MKIIYLFVTVFTVSFTAFTQSQLAYANENVKLLDSTFKEVETLSEGGSFVSFQFIHHERNIQSKTFEKW